MFPYVCPFPFCSLVNSHFLERDSLKDETVVFVFIFATAGLLAWALVKPWVDRLRERTAFVPLLSQQQQHHDDGRTPTGRNAFRDLSGGIGQPPRTERWGSPHTESRHSARGAAAAAASSPSGPGRVHADQDAVDIVSDSRSRP